MQSKRFEELKATGLMPSPTGIGLEILRLTRDESSTVNDIARVLRADPALTGRTLRLANTGNAVASRPILNVSEAVARLGMRTVNAVALSFTVLAGNRSGKCRNFDYPRFWSHSLATAVASQAICAHSKRYAGADAFTVGLLSQVGRIALASIHAEQYAAVLSEWNHGRPQDLINHEHKAFVTNHNELSSVMLADWGMPEPLCNAVLYAELTDDRSAKPQSEARYLASILHAAFRMADVCVAATDADAAALTRDLLKRCDLCGIKADETIQLFDRIYGQWAEWGRVLDVTTHKRLRLAELIETCQAAGGDDEDDATPPEETESPSSLVQPEVNAPTDDQEGLLVLIADGDLASLRFLEKFLVLSGHRVRCAAGGREALQVFFETAPQLVIVDAMLPEIGGLEFCRRLRQTTAGKQAYVIMLTPPNDDETLVRLFEVGVDDFVIKPFAARPLFARIRASLRVVSLQEKVTRDRHEIEKVQSELAIAHRRLEQDALTDVLTGLPNRRYLIDRLAHDWAAARRGGTPLACMVLDIDHFKRVNDTYGHDVGDVVLRSVGGVLQQEVRGTDVVCRFGGEEFVVVSAADMDSAIRCGERLRLAVEEQTIGRVSQLKHPLTVSIGVAVRNEQTRSPEALLKAADEALFWAKRIGRNRVASTRDQADECTASSPNVRLATAAVASDGR